MIIELFVWGIILYFVYKFVFGFLAPLFKVASQMKDSVAEMQRQQAAQPHETKQQPAAGKVQSKPTTTNTNEEYIDFEEVK